MNYGYKLIVKILLRMSELKEFESPLVAVAVTWFFYRICLINVMNVFIRMLVNQAAPPWILQEKMSS